MSNNVKIWGKLDKNGYIIMVERVRRVIFVNEDCDC